MLVAINKRLVLMATIHAGETFCVVESCIPHYYIRVTDSNWVTMTSQQVPAVELSTGKTVAFNRETMVLPLELMVTETPQEHP